MTLILSNCYQKNVKILKIFRSNRHGHFYQRHSRFHFNLRAAPSSQNPQDFRSIGASEKGELNFYKNHKKLNIIDKQIF
jgi:hypothetical protein